MNIVVVGAGYVGLVAACCLANSGHQVTCVEANEAKLKLLNQGLSPIHEKGIDQLLKQEFSLGKLTFSSVLPTPLQADIVMVTVGTPSLPSGAADLCHIYHIAAEVKDAAKHPFRTICVSNHLSQVD